jgi:uncharacterized protein (TIGR03083 family)
MRSTSLNRREILRALTDEREALVRDIAQVTTADWEAPSLCGGWAVRDVVGHLLRVEALYRNAAPFFVGLARYGFRINAYIAEDARRRSAGQSPDALLADLAETRYETTLGARLHPVPSIPFSEWVIHGQDIRRPLAIARVTPIDRFSAVADALFGRNGYPWGRRRRPLGRFEATDADWKRGDGEAVRAPLEEIVMMLAGRTV